MKKTSNVKRHSERAQNNVLHSGAVMVLRGFKGVYEKFVLDRVTFGGMYPILPQPTERKQRCNIRDDGEVWIEYCLVDDYDTLFQFMSPEKYKGKPVIVAAELCDAAGMAAVGRLFMEKMCNAGGN